MTDRIKQLKKFFITDKAHHAQRKVPTDKYCLIDGFKRSGCGLNQRAAGIIQYMMKNETPVVFPIERIAFMRTVPVIPEIFSDEEKNAFGKTHEAGAVGNINVDYMKLLDVGFDAKIAEIDRLITQYEEARNEKAEYLKIVKSVMLSVLELCDRYSAEAKRIGNETVAKTLSHIPRKAPETLLEALQMFRIIHFTMWAGGNNHCTVGRFDQYMLPYLEHDISAGILTKESATELIEEFFITFNRDSDLYPGVQQGDNGQSMVLGGTDESGADGFNILSEICLEASLELKLIDPKINLRVSKNTPLSVYESGTRLTKQGLGFPQYSNDDVVIKALMDWGYEKKDAYNYVVAACWEFIVPGCGMDIPNVDAFSFAAAAEKAIREHLTECKTFEQLWSFVLSELKKQVTEICEKTKGIRLHPAPFISLMMDGCIENATDISEGNKYNNYGIHGAGLSCAVDSLAAIKKYVFDTGEVKSDELIAALAANYNGYDELYHRMRYTAPKFGDNDAATDEIAAKLLGAFADSLEGKRNDRGGIFRAGTGTAMYYIWYSRDLPATADGRMAGEPFPANYSPSLFNRCPGPVSVIKSFTAPDLSRVANGGPLTLELHDTLFRNNESITKTASMIKSFIDLGGHQLQINAVNRDKLLDAQRHPENYTNLIVRVWGWSGYFTQLDRVYQDHVISRTEFNV